jgi:hypothetical protein
MSKTIVIDMEPLLESLVLTRFISIGTVILLLILSIPLRAQNLSGAQLDSLYNSFVSLHPATAQHLGIKTTHPLIRAAGITHVKCGTPEVVAVRANFNRFKPTERVILQSLLDRPSTDTSFVTPKGFFRVHYDTSGSNAPTYSLDSLATALDSAYSFEVNFLGYPSPPSDNGAGGDNRYDIYISNIVNDYGFTTPDSEIMPGSNRFTSFMTINNDYSLFSDTNIVNLDYRGTKGINAARVTVAHEFHHAIQMGDYILRYDLDEFFHELTSVSMEHFVYPTIRDYLQYLPTYFSNTQHSLSLNYTTSGNLQEYALAIWNIFLKDKYGYDIIKKQWELMPQMRALQAIENTLADYQTSFTQELNQFGIWTYFTNYRTVPSYHYFEDASYYPVIQPVANLTLSSSTININLTSAPVSNNFISFFNPATKDSLATIITNCDVEKGIDHIDTNLAFNFSLSNTPQNGSITLTNNYYETFNTDQPAFWNSSAILNNQVINSEVPIVENSNFVFPSPFNYKKNAYIYIPANPDVSGGTFVNIYTPAMKLVYSVYQPLIYIYGQKVIRWNGLDNNNYKLSSGVYIYVTKSGDNVKKGKLVIFNE